MKSLRLPFRCSSSRGRPMGRQMERSIEKPLLLKRAFNLAIQAEKLLKKPYMQRLEEKNVRQGFFEPWQFDALLSKLPDSLRPPMTFAYWTGWRLYSEVLSLTWEQVDLDAGTVRLLPGTTKNGEGRVLFLT